MKVRPAHPGDAPRLVEMGLRFRHSTGYANVIGENAAQIAALVAMLLQVGTIFVAERDEDEALVGMLGAYIGPHPISGEPTASEVAWWIDPAHRGGGIARALLDTYEEWAREMGARSVTMIEPFGSGVGTVYARRGYAAVETTYQKVL